MIRAHHVVRVVNDAVDQLSDVVFDHVYPGGGRPPYHPKLMAKILVYAYTQRLYSSRQIAKAVREQIPFLWLTGRQTPDFRTINGFRGERMNTIVDDVFAGILTLLIEQDSVTLDAYFLDGTKMETNANRYTYVCKKSVQGSQDKLTVAIRDLLQQIEAVVQAENAKYPLDSAGATTPRLPSSHQSSWRTDVRSVREPARISTALVAPIGASMSSRSVYNTHSVVRSEPEEGCRQVLALRPGSLTLIIVE